MGRTSDARQRLIGAAHELIWEWSYGAVTIDAICERASVKKGSFYYFFESKSELAQVTLENWWNERRTLMDRIFDRQFSPLDRMRSYFDFVSLRQLRAYETTGQVLGCPIFTLGAEISTQDESLRCRVHEILKAIIQYFETAIRDAQTRGELPGHDASQKAHQLISYYEGFLTKARIENNAEALRNLSSEVLESIGAQPVLAAA